MKNIHLIRKWVTGIESFKQALMRTLFLFLAMPTFVMAGVKIDNTISIDAGLTIKFISIVIASLCGGISSTFVNTSFDDGIKHPNLFKIFVGTTLGTCSGMLILDQFSFGIFSMVLPIFIIASLGAPIMVFYLMWLSNPETQAEIKEQIKQKVRDKLGVNK